MASNNAFKNERERFQAIKEFRVIKQNLSFEKLAEITGFQVVAVRKWIDGKMPTPKAFYKIRDYFLENGGSF